MWKCSSLSHVQLIVNPWTIVHQASLSLGFSRQESWKGLPFPPPGDLSNAGMEPGSPELQEDSLQSKPPGKSLSIHWGLSKTYNKCLFITLVPLSHWVLNTALFDYKCMIFGLPQWLRCKESTCNIGDRCRKHWFNPWVEKIPQEEGMATQSSILVWRFPWTEEPGKLESMWWLEVGHDWSDLACT